MIKISHGHANKSALDAVTNTNTGDQDLSGLLTKTQYADINRQGFTNLTETSIAFDGTNTFTITGTNWTYYRAGVKYTVATNKTVTLSATPPATAGEYFIYIDATDGTLTASTTPWTLQDSKVPVATIAWNNSLTPKYWIADERHTALIDQRMQYYLHTLDGARPVTIPSITGTYVLDSGTDADKTFGLSAGALLDQDIKHVPALLNEGDGTTTPYVVWYRTGASTWAWKYSAMPFVYNVGNTNNVIQWDNGGTMTDTTVSVGALKRYTNSYVLMTNKTGDARYIFISGRGEYATIALAQSESITSFTWTGFEIDESVICYRCTWLAKSASGKGSCELAVAPALVGISTVTNSSSGAGTDHNTLSNLQGGTTGEYYHLTTTELAALHPAVTISDTASVNLTLTGQVLSADVLPAGVDHGGLGGLGDDDHTQYLLATGSRTGAGTGVQTFTYPLIYPAKDSILSHADGDNFNQNSASTPTGWTEVDAGSANNTSVKFGYWNINTTSVNTAFKYRKQMSAITEGSYYGISFNDILFRDGAYTADLDYWFGIYGDDGSGTIVEGMYNRVNLHWNSTINVWQIRHELNDNAGTTYNGTYYNLSFPLVQPLYIRIVQRSNDNTAKRGYVGTNIDPQSHSLLQTKTLAYTMNTPWIQISSSRGTGVDAYGFIGGIDRTENA